MSEIFSATASPAWLLTNSPSGAQTSLSTVTGSLTLPAGAAATSLMLQPGLSASLTGALTAHGSPSPSGLTSNSSGATSVLGHCGGNCIGASSGGTGGVLRLADVVEALRIVQQQTSASACQMTSPATTPVTSSAMASQTSINSSISGTTNLLSSPGVVTGQSAAGPGTLVSVGVGSTTAGLSNIPTLSSTGQQQHQQLGSSSSSSSPNTVQVFGSGPHLPANLVSLVANLAASGNPVALAAAAALMSNSSSNSSITGGLGNNASPVHSSSSSLQSGGHSQVAAVSTATLPASLLGHLASKFPLIATSVSGNGTSFLTSPINSTTATGSSNGIGSVSGNSTAATITFTTANNGGNSNASSGHPGELLTPPTSSSSATGLNGLALASAQGLMFANSRTSQVTGQPRVTSQSHSLASTGSVSSSMPSTSFSMRLNSTDCRLDESASSLSTTAIASIKGCIQTVPGSSALNEPSSDASTTVNSNTDSATAAAATVALASSIEQALDMTVGLCQLVAKRAYQIISM
ncbi:unnamed protein product [Protopolystoma xenopodis]|uniref:Uncharacterized protein n=1 Tax=Protopolystoma xenopodis TaxID=117903 RepID=A0A448WUW6_9PLAT|nr:unnamed protein product [Protopolystoma xenopodis]